MTRKPDMGVYPPGTGTDITPRLAYIAEYFDNARNYGPEYAATIREGITRLSEKEAELAQCREALSEQDRLLSVLDLDLMTEHDCLILETLVSDAKARTALKGTSHEPTI